MTTRPTANLPPFVPRPAGPWRRWTAITVLSLAFAVICVLYGAAFALFAPYLLVALIAPVMLLLAVAVWALPDNPALKDTWLNSLFVAYVLALFLWPNYIAVALPGLPWITMARLTGVPLCLAFLLLVSMSRPFRVKLSDVLSADGLTWKLVLGFAVCQLISIAFSKAPGQSLDRFLTAQLSCTFVYFISAYAFSRPGVAQRWALVLAISAFVVCGLGMWEWRLQHVPWLGHIPAFLKISDDVVDAILRGGARSADGVYRVQGIFTNSLAFAEFNALTVPFLVYGFRANRNPYVRTAILAGVILLVFAIMMSGSRLGAVGTLVGLLVYVAIWAYQLYRTRPQNLIAPAVLFSYPILALGAVASTFLIHGIRIHVWGNGVQQASNDSRIQQYRMGIPLVLKAPWGHGVGQCAVVLGFYEPSGLLTIDSYYLAVALDDGVMGFLVFYGLLSYAALKGVTRAIRSPAPQSDIELGLPAGIAILAFIIIKSVFSQLDNNSLVYMMLGLLTAMSYKASRADAAKAGHHLASKGRST